MTKNLLNRVRLSLKVLRTGVMPLPEQSCILKIVDDESQKLHESFGLTMERTIELQEISAEQWHNNKHLSEAMVGMSKRAKHPNELAWMMLQLGANLQDRKYANNPLSALFDKFLGHMRDDKDDE